MILLGQQNSFVRSTEHFCYTNSFVRLTKRPNKKFFLAQQNSFVAQITTKFWLDKQNCFLSALFYGKFILKKSAYFFTRSRLIKNKLLKSPYFDFIEIFYINYIEALITRISIEFIFKNNNSNNRQKY